MGVIDDMISADDNHGASNRHQCFVYLMIADAPIPKSDEELLRTEIFKVGISESPSNRLSSIRTACPFEVKMPWTWRMPSKISARSVEKKFHEMNHERRLFGEWFHYTAIGAACELDHLCSEWWYEVHGLNGLEDFLISVGMDRDRAVNHIIATYTGEGTIQ